MTFVLGYDDSEAAQRALTVALDLASRYDEPLVLVFGIQPPGGMGEEFLAHQAALKELGREVTAQAVVLAEAAGVTAEVALVHAKPAQALADVADERDARMIIVGSHGESALRVALLGSTPHKVLQLTDRPVLVV